MKDLVHNCLNEILRGLAPTIPVRELLAEQPRIEDIERRWDAGQKMDPADCAMLARVIRVVAEDLGESEFHTRVGEELDEAFAAIEVFERLSAPREVWIFQSGRLASGVFSSQETAERWILQHKLDGLLTQYLLDVSAYDRALADRRIKAKSAAAIAQFSDGEVPFHYESGVRVA